MAQKFVGNLQVLDTQVGGSVPAGWIELKVRAAEGNPFRTRMSLEQYERQVILKPSPHTTVNDHA
jgi:hypothetical protein